MTKEFTPLPQEAPCPYFGECGGCSLQNISNSGEYKEFLLKKSLKNIDTKIHNIYQISTNSRRRANFKVTNNKLSFNQFHSKNTLAIANCLLLENSINNLITPINNLLKKTKNKITSINITNSDTGIEIVFQAQEKSDLDTEIMITEFAKAHNIAIAAWQTKTHPAYVIIQYKPAQLKFKNIHVNLPINSFLQVSKESNDLMAKIILQYLDKSKQILELYCGIGSFTIPISDKGQITAIEGSEEAIKALEKTIKNHQLPIKTIIKDLYQTPLPYNALNKYSQIVINPPRNGATPQIKQISEAKSVEKVILISCSLENFTRDAKILLKSDFTLTDVYPIDQFLYSKHLEIIGIFQKP
ncbi:MAG: methyltransferase [Rickettsiales bacterium]|jgi:23S rRNA (uracil1939-C5)-methyltransferase|nr:methyltransferase [Rickettsiales bacterium]